MYTIMYMIVYEDVSVQMYLYTVHVCILYLKLHTNDICI